MGLNIILLAFIICGYFKKGSGNTFGAGWALLPFLFGPLRTLSYFFVVVFFLFIMICFFMIDMYCLTFPNATIRN